MTLRFSHRAMGTRFDMWLCGEDRGHLQSVAFQAWEEVDRLESLLSRYDSRAEIARVNREAAERPVRVDVELFGVLKECQQWAKRTTGFFDIAYASGTHLLQGNKSVYTLNEEQRTVHFSQQGVSLDLGGYGKGYTLDRVAEILRTYSIDSACVHGGHSSVIAIGTRENETPWVVAVPTGKDPNQIAYNRPLYNEGFSYSAIASEEENVSDIVNPHQNHVLSEGPACWVVSPSALNAEVWTTALLAMGRTNAEQAFSGPLYGVSEWGWT